MKYYKVKSENDNVAVYTVRGGLIRNEGLILVGDELYTQTEYRNLVTKCLYKTEKSNDYASFRNLFEVVNIPKNKVYRLFGARFEA